METGEKMKRLISDLVEQNTMLQQNKDSVEAAFQKVSDEFIKLWTLYNNLQAKLKCIEDCWKVSHKDVLKTDKKLGDGGYGAVHEGWFHNQKVAIKQLHQIIVSDTNIEKIHDEINTMSRLRHPNLVLFIGAVFDHPSGNPLIITELMDMSLRDAYEKKLLTSEREKLVIMRDVAAGLNYLHCLPRPHHPQRCQFCQCIANI